MMRFVWEIFRLGKRMIPNCIKIRTNAETYGIKQFMKLSSQLVDSSELVLDAGAGACPYKKYFSYGKYESTDRDHPILNKIYTGDKHTFICDLDNIPIRNSSYEVVINTQVLEHVEYPQRVIDEFYRILRSGGKLFLTAPQGYELHGAPYHFFNFTKYGLESLFLNAGFQIIFIRPMGGIFWYLSDKLRKLPSHILSQYVFEISQGCAIIEPKPLAFILLPLYLISMPICGFMIPILFFYLDKLDKKQDFTLNYVCYCKKP